MTNRHVIDSTAQIHALSDPRRLQILRRLMAQPATISQLGRIFGEHPACGFHEGSPFLLQCIRLIQNNLQGFLEGDHQHSDWECEGRDFLVMDKQIPPPLTASKSSG